jgi:hypothetical protein
MNEVRDKERIRKALEAALDSLDAPTEAGTPIIIVLGDSRSSGQSPTVQIKQSIGDAKPYNGLASSHPGLQRFANLETESPAPAFKSCFMEPDRECVHSGACEMRGY